eukprot:2587869-Prymnesium_polylepis.5
MAQVVDAPLLPFVFGELHLSPLVGRGCPHRALQRVCESLVHQLSAAVGARRTDTGPPQTERRVPRQRLLSSGRQRLKGFQTSLQRLLCALASGVPDVGRSHDQMGGRLHSECKPLQRAVHERRV